MHRLTGTVEMFDKLDDAAFVMEFVTFSVAFIFENDSHTTIQKSQFLEPFVQNVVDEFGCLKDGRIRLERRFGSHLFRLAALGYGAFGNATFVFLLMNRTVRNTSTSHHSDRKFTTVTPTPCSPPEVW